MNKYYVYIYFDPSKKGQFIYDNLKFNFEPFYIGKGTGNRYKCHLDSKNYNNDYKLNKISSIRKNGFEPLYLYLKII